MEALRYSSYGSPDEVLRLVDLESDSPGPGEVAIAVLAVPIHLKDLYFMTGRPGFRLPLPAIPGNQGFGRIIDIGSAVSGYDVGDPVHVLHCEPWTQPLRPGTWRGETVVPASSVFPSVDGNPMQMSLVSSSLISADLLLLSAMATLKGEWVIQNAANSSCGRFIIQLAKSRGIKTINVVRRRDFDEELTALGADVVILDDDELSTEVARITEGKMPSVALDAVGGASAGRLANCLASGGAVISYGMASGVVADIPSELLIFKGIVHRGFLMDRDFQALDLSSRSQLFRRLSAMIHEQTVTANVAGGYTLSEFSDAIAHAQKSGEGRNGKVVLLPGGRG